MREDGFYWIKIERKRESYWIVAEFYSGVWCFIGDDMERSDEEIEGVNETRIKNPDEQKPYAQNTK